MPCILGRYFGSVWPINPETAKKTTEKVRTMLMIISPSKTQDFRTQDLISYTLPTLLDQSCRLIEYLRKLDEARIGLLMKTSRKLSQSSWESFQDFNVPFEIANAKQALLAFKGEVYSGIRVDQYSKEDFQFAQAHLRILSGLYGILKPLDLIQPYRLEMSTALATERGESLYTFWGDLLTDEVNRALVSFADPLLVNLASLEYFKALVPAKIKARIVNVVFKEKKNGAYRTIAIHAKKARGKMVNFVITERLSKVGELTSFSEDGYRFSEDLSSASDMVFCRG